MPDYRGRVTQIVRALSLMDVGRLGDLTKGVMMSHSRQYVDFLAKTLKGREVDILLHHPNTMESMDILDDKAFAFVSSS